MSESKRTYGHFDVHTGTQSKSVSPAHSDLVSESKKPSEYSDIHIKWPDVRVQDGIDIWWVNVNIGIPTWSLTSRDTDVLLNSDISLSRSPRQHLSFQMFTLTDQISMTEKVSASLDGKVQGRVWAFRCSHWLPQMSVQKDIIWWVDMNIWMPRSSQTSGDTDALTYQMLVKITD